MEDYTDTQEEKLSLRNLINHKVIIKKVSLNIKSFSIKSDEMRGDFN